MSDFRGTGTLAIKLPMNSNDRNIHSKIFEMSETTEEQAVSNYINLLLTKPGERYMQPAFGIGLQLYIFENDGNGGLEIKIKDLIEFESAKWLPYIFNNNIDVVSEDNSIFITIDFTVGRNGANKTITLTGNSETFDLDIEVN